MSSQSYVNIQRELLKNERQALDTLNRFRNIYLLNDEDYVRLRDIENRMFYRYMRRSDKTINHRIG